MTHIIETSVRQPLEIVSGEGSTVYDADGNAYLDLVAGLAVCSVGHCHPRVVDAIAEQSKRLLHASNLYATQPQQALAARLAELTGGMQSFFCNSGAEAVEAAIKLARKWGGPRRHRIVAADGAFHGRTFGALSATGQPGKKKAFEPLVPGFDHVPFGDIGSLRSALGPDCVAVLLEPIQGEAGVVVPPEDYLQDVRALCDEAGVLLILDEVQTGIGRTGAWFAHQLFAVRPDVMCLAKGLAAGLPIGACLATPAIASHFVPGDHASTFGGGPIPCSAALAVLDVIDQERLIENAAHVGELFAKRLGDLPGVEEVRGRGLLVGVVLAADKAADVVAASLDARVLVNEAAPNVVRLCPPLVLTDREAERGCEVVEAAINRVMS